MKKLLQLTISISLLMIFSCSGGGEGTTIDPDLALEQTWFATDMKAYDSPTCASSTLFTISGSEVGGMNIDSGEECLNASYYFAGLNEDICFWDDDGDGEEGTPYVLNTDFNVDTEFYLHLVSTDTLSNEASGDFTRTMYGTYPSGLFFESPYSTFGRFYTHDNNLIMERHAIIESSDGDDDNGTVWTDGGTTWSDGDTTWDGDACLDSDAVDTGAVDEPACEADDSCLDSDGNPTASADEVTCEAEGDECVGDDTLTEDDCGADDTSTNTRVVSSIQANPTEWQYDATATTLTIRNITELGDGDAELECLEYTFKIATNYGLKGCTDETAANYLGVEENDFGIAATIEDGSCVYSVDEATFPCALIVQNDDDFDGEYSDEETVSSSGVIDCAGNCVYVGQSSWSNDMYCDNGSGPRDNIDLNVDFNCEAFDYDSWACACNVDCISDFDSETTDGTGFAGGTDDDAIYDEDDQVGEGNSFDADNPDDFDAGNCQAGCNVEACGYDIGNLADLTTWDCCPGVCIVQLNTDPAIEVPTCNVPECNYYRVAGADIGAFCDQTGVDATADTPDDIDCSTFHADDNADGLGGNGECDASCNVGACNFDGGDCEED